MKKLILVVLLVSSTAFAADQIITGEVIDSFCYATRDAKGKEHAQCAASCIKAGVPAAILTSDGTIYWPYRQDHKTANPLFEKFGGEIVNVKGTVYEKNNTKFIVVSSVEKAK